VLRGVLFFPSLVIMGFWLVQLGSPQRPKISQDGKAEVWFDFPPLSLFPRDRHIHCAAAFRLLVSYRPLALILRFPRSSPLQASLLADGERNVFPVHNPLFFLP